ncbi:MAG TPA: SRPBCC family protein [Burkholderiales bacterium]|nr:SRPBCC family protein [Burkholderiales bacterium]
MATIRKSLLVDSPVERVWDAFRDVGQVHARLAPGFVTACRLEGGARVVTFANGLVATELIVDLDDEARRLAYSARSERLVHHHATFQVFDHGPDRTRIVWTADVLPHEASRVVEPMMEEGCRAMKRTLESTVR